MWSDSSTMSTLDSPNMSTLDSPTTNTLDSPTAITVPNPPFTDAAKSTIEGAPNSLMVRGPTTTNILDHFMHLTPPGTLDEATEQFEELGFNVSPGGEHSSGLTKNALIFLADGTYLEIISFTKRPASFYSPNSPSRLALEKNPLANKLPGWVNAAHLGVSPDNDIAKEIAERADRTGSEVKYKPAVPGGRTRTDGKIVEWTITASESDVGLLPFFCTDITPRELRVPADESNTTHPCTARAISHIHLLCPESYMEDFAGQLTAVIGTEPIATEASWSEFVWELLTPGNRNSEAEADVLLRPRVILSSPQDEEEEEHLYERGSSIYDVGIYVEPDSGKEGTVMSPYGRITWMPLEGIQNGS